MSSIHCRAQGCKPAGLDGLLKIRAGNLVSQVNQYFGNTAHPDTAYTDKMHFF